MRHGDKINNLSRTASHRKALMANLASELIKHKRIFTTLAKAKALRTYVEPLLTRGKTDSMHNRRTIFAYLKNKEVIDVLFGDIAPKIKERNGGYTRVIKMGNRKGDAAEMAMIELVDFNDIYSNNKTAKTAKKTRTRRAGKTKKTENKAAEETQTNTDDTKE